MLSSSSTMSIFFAMFFILLGSVLLITTIETGPWYDSFSVLIILLRSFLSVTGLVDNHLIVLLPPDVSLLFLFSLTRGRQESHQLTLQAYSFYSTIKQVCLLLES